jgi:hypothetical protein
VNCLKNFFFQLFGASGQVGTGDAASGGINTKGDFVVIYVQWKYII